MANPVGRMMMIGSNCTRRVSSSCCRPSSSFCVVKNAKRGFVVFPDVPVGGVLKIEKEKYQLPHRNRNKVVSAEDAVSLIRPGDTISVAGFVCQSSPEALLRTLGERYEKTGEPHSLTLLFGNGPGDYGERGLNHLAKISDEPGVPPLLQRTIAGHYGQTPKIAQLALDELVEAHTLPIGSISRMIRAQASHAPGHITTVGIGTFIDPDTGNGGAVNQLAMQSELHKHLITRVNIQGQDYLLYKALPIDVALIRATTADSMGNLTLEDESLLCDQMINAAAAKNSGGLVLAQVKRLAAVGSMQTREVAVPGPMVDCVVVVDDDEHERDHCMSYLTTDDPVLTNQIRTSYDDIPKLAFTPTKVIARRAAMELRPGRFVNLGFGIPDAVASVASEEGLLDTITLTTTPGVIGGIPANGLEYGPSANADAMIEMNQMYDITNGGMLDMCYLTAAQIGPHGDVNGSRTSLDMLTGAGSVIDLSSSTRIVCFMTTFNTKGLEVSLPGDGTIGIQKEGKVKKFVNDLLEKSFNADEAMRRGQQVYYITERAVFRRSPTHRTLELIEIAPGIDLEKDILAQMEFEPIISPKLKLMDERLFKEARMDIDDEIYGSLEDRCTYNKAEHSIYLDFLGVSLATEEDVRTLLSEVQKLFDRYSDNGKNKFDIYINYDGFDIKPALQEIYGKLAGELQQKYYKSVKRFGGKAFRRAKFGRDMNISGMDADAIIASLDRDGNGMISAAEAREGLWELMNIRLTERDLFSYSKGDERTEKTIEEFKVWLEENITGKIEKRRGV